MGMGFSLPSLFPMLLCDQEVFIQEEGLVYGIDDSKLVITITHSRRLSKMRAHTSGSQRTAGFSPTQG